MSPTADVQTPAAAALIYEHPLAERTRTFLRLEALYQQFLYHVEESSSWATRAAMGCMLDMVVILSRGDVRSDVLKDLDRQLLMLDRYQNRPSVDEERLASVLRHLRALRDDVAGIGSQFLQPLRENEFLNAIKHRSGIPGGACEFDLPEYSHWLRRPYADRVADIQFWMSTIKPLCNSIAELLWLMRRSTTPVEQIAVHGAYNNVLSKDSAGSMLRIILPPDTLLYPEISGSQHRFTMRFMQWSDAMNRPVQTATDVRFQLAIC